MGEQGGTSRVRLRRPQVLEPTPPVPDGVARRDPMWGAATALVVALGALAGPLERWRPAWPWRTIGATGMLVAMVVIAAAIVIAWRRASALARRALADDGGDAG